MTKSFFCLLAMILVLPLPVEAAEKAQTLQTSPLSSVNLLQTIFGLIMVLACIMLVAWLFRGMNNFQSRANGQLKMITGLPVGQRERIVVVQVGDEQLLLGVTPHSITTLHQLSEPLSPDINQSNGAFSQKLADILKQKGSK